MNRSEWIIVIACSLGIAAILAFVVALCTGHISITFERL